MPFFKRGFNLAEIRANPNTDVCFDKVRIYKLRRHTSKHLINGAKNLLLHNTQNVFHSCKFSIVHKLSYPPRSILQTKSLCHFVGFWKNYFWCMADGRI